MTRFIWVLFGLASLAVNAQETVLFEGTARPPFELFVGDKKGWATPVGEAQTVSNSGYLTVDPGAEPGSLRATWSGKGEAQLYLGSADPQDLSGLVEADAALVTLLQVHTAPNKKVTLRMGCGDSCSANADIRPLLKALPKDEWLRVSFDLKCFADGGLNPRTVYSPFLVLTRGRLGMSFSDVRITPGAGPTATIKCR